MPTTNTTPATTGAPFTPYTGGPGVDPAALARMTRDALDALFSASGPGPIPEGQARGTALILPGSALDPLLQGLVRALWWKGKVFSPATHDLKNRIGLFGTRLIRANVYEDASWFSPGPAIILDYSKTSTVAGKIRDEIRQVGPGLYLGQVYWGQARIALFMLEFPRAGAGAP